MMVALNTHFSACGAALFCSQSFAGKCCHFSYTQNIYGQFRGSSSCRYSWTIFQSSGPSWPQLLLCVKEDTPDFSKQCSSQHGVTVSYSNDRFCAEYHFKGDAQQPGDYFESGGAAGKGNRDTSRKREPTWFIFHGITWWAGSNAGERGRGGIADDNMHCVYYVCQRKRCTVCDLRLACVSL